LPVLVSRVAPNTPADSAVPKLNEGDQVMSVNGNDVENLTHDQVLLVNVTCLFFVYKHFFHLFFKVVKLIRSTKDNQPEGELVLTIRPLGRFLYFL
jgi:tyrosine-protein phosphatase non-receptor type 4